MVAEPGVIQQLVAPAVMVPACGLLLLSSTARMNTVLARIRAFHREQLDIWCQDPEEASRSARVRDLRLNGLERQTERLLLRARLLRLTMLQLFAAILCNLLAVFGLAIDYTLESSPLPAHTISVVVFLIGIAGMVGAMVTSVLEVRRITETVEYEHSRVERLIAGPPNGFEPSRPEQGEGIGL
ncbi:MAG: DUF2721 domain-containing protein [Planctomycetota bacterium]